MASTNETAKRGSRDYIFRRPGSPNYYVKLRSPGEKPGDKYTRTEISLHTPDREKALLEAHNLIGEHKRKLYEARPRLVASWHREYEPGLHTGPNGERIAATEHELSVYDADGKLLRTEPNGYAVNKLVNMPLGAVLVGEGHTRPLAELRRIGPIVNVS